MCVRFNVEDAFSIWLSYHLLSSTVPLLHTMSIFQRDPRAGAFLGGDRVSGQDVRDQNGAYARPKTMDYAADVKQLVLAAQSIANIVKSSLGPLGLDKMLVDNIGVRDCSLTL